MTERMRAWVLTRRCELLAPTFMDAEAIAEVVGKQLLGVDVVVVSDELQLDPAEISFSVQEASEGAPERVSRETGVPEGLAPATVTPDREPPAPTKPEPTSASLTSSEAKEQEPPHGIKRYRSLGCRCEVCRDAKREERLTERERKGLPPPKPRAPIGLIAVDPAKSRKPAPEPVAPRTTSKVTIKKCDSLIAKCPGCETDVYGSARIVVANVYVEGKWDRIERWHIECYEGARAPHGAPEEAQLVKGKSWVTAKDKVACLVCSKEFEPRQARQQICSATCRARRKTDLILEQRSSTTADPPPQQQSIQAPINHGYGGYQKGCRCVMCVEGRRAYQREWQEKRKAATAEA